ncbi:putative protein phosphatase 2C [Trifolium repens]|nr:putative protein phosphatase 2C [Trifolium repens]
MRKTEDAFFNIIDEMINHNPVLAMMGSCVLVMLMKGEDVYLLNVGDSRPVLATGIGNHPQLTMDHSTHVKEVYRIRQEHRDDPSAVVTKDRVKGYLNITRAFGAGFLKQCILEDRGGCKRWDGCPRSTGKPSRILARLNKMARYDPDDEIGLYEVKAFHIYDVKRVAEQLGLDDPSKIRLTPHNLVWLIIIVGA